MQGTWKLRLFERVAGSRPVDCVAQDDDYALTDEEVDRIARSLIGEATPDDNQQREADGGGRRAAP